VSPFEAMLGTFFNGALSAAVTYTPQGGEPVQVRASVGIVDPVMGPVRGTMLQAKILSFDFLRSELPTAPKRGDTIAYNGEVFGVAGPAEPDADGLVWRVRANRGG